MKFALSVLVTSLVCVSACAEAGPQVKIDSGAIAGAVAEGVEAFRGIPFAAPPVGNLRWRAPQPVKAWTGVRDATQYGHDCMQTPFPSDAAPLGTTPDEDCLVANVWRPAGAKPGQKLPVIVWIYGGGFVNGGSSPDVYAGDSFARKGVIMVSFNYRLGRFGFFGFPALTKADADHGLLGNYGFMDQIAALKWVQRNAAAFGGDPANVTIFGESAGGGSVHTLLTTPLAKGLFVRAIVESGGGRGYLLGDRRLSQDLPTAKSSETLGVALAQKNGITGTDAAALARLRALPAAVINDGLNMASMMQTATYGGPMVDGRIVVESPQAAYTSGRWARVPVMIGANSDDIGFFGAPDKAAAFATFGAGAAAAKAAYDPDGTADDKTVIHRMAMDRMMVEPARFVAATIASQGIASYEFRFSYAADSMRGQWTGGAPHATEIPYVMNTVKAKYGADLTAKDAAIADATNSYWANFAKTGNPNGAGLPQWPAYDPAKDVIMDFAADGQATPAADAWKPRLDATAAVQ